MYKYFPGVEEILDAWHERHRVAHLEQLHAEAANDRTPFARLTTVPAAYAQVRQRQLEHTSGSPGIELTNYLHRPDGAASAAQEEIYDLVESLIIEAANCGEIRSDIAPAELTRYCLHALGAAAHTESKAARQRLLEPILFGLRRGENDASGT